MRIEAWVRFVWLPGVYSKEMDLSSDTNKTLKKTVEKLENALTSSQPKNNYNPINSKNSEIKVLIYGNEVFAKDMEWGFGECGCIVEKISNVSVEEFDRKIKNMQPNVLITLGAPLELDKDVLKYICERPLKSMIYIHWDTDGMITKHYNSIYGDGIVMDVVYLGKPDLIFTICPDLLNFLKSKNFKCDILNYGYSPLTHFPMNKNKRYDNFLNVIGQSYYDHFLMDKGHFRYKGIEILMKSLLQNNYTINFYGNVLYKKILDELLNMDVPLEYFNEHLPYDKTCEVYNNSFINLATQNQDNTVTKRTFEIMACGGFMITVDSSAIRELFVPNQDLVVSSDSEQTLELVKYYEKNLDKYYEMRENGLRAVKKHSYKNRAEYILSKIKS